jgi:signal transduction histidine kinase
MRVKAKSVSRLAWSVGIVSIALLIGVLVLMFIDRHVALPDIASAAHWDFANVLSAAVNIAVPAIGIVIASKRPQNPIGWLFLAAGFTLGLSGFGLSYGVHALVVDPGSLPAGRLFAWAQSWIGLIPLGVLAFLFLLFPTGHLRSPRWRPAAWFVGGGFALVTASSIVYSTQSWSDPFGHGPSGGGGALIGLVLFAVPLIVGLGASLAAVIVRFRGSVGDERLQLKWFASAAALVVATFLAAFVAGSNTPPPAVSILQSVAFVFLWTAIGIAVLKYRLYEIDVVISKAVVYGTLAVFITLVYVGLVVGIGTLVGNRRSPLLSAIAAAVIAVAFQPIRERSGRVANRLVYGKRATPYEVLSDFAERVAGTYAVEEVLPRTARMLAEGTGAVRADVWLLVGHELRASGSWPATETEHIPLAEDGSIDVPGAARVVPVRYQGELLGALSVQKAPSDTITSTDEKLLADVASQAGLVLRNVRLIEDLRASRQRIVAAQDAAARRLERNIHDGAQQQLVALAVKLNLAGALVGKDPEKGRAIIEQMKADTTDALEDLRNLARGIYPPLLADQGLVAALRSQTRRSTIPVSVEADGVGRFSQDTEAAVYFCALEALQNVAKYANARTASVGLAEDGDWLTFAVRDDGLGFDPAAKVHGTGLQGMADRLAALGGELRVTSALGNGTVIEGRVPVDRMGAGALGPL